MSTHDDAVGWSKARASSAARWAIDAGAADGVALIAATLAGNADALGLVGPCPPRVIARLTEVPIPECRAALQWLRRHGAITYARRPGLPTSVIVSRELLDGSGPDDQGQPRPSRAPRRQRRGAL